MKKVISSPAKYNKNHIITSEKKKKKVISSLVKYFTLEIVKLSH